MDGDPKFTAGQVIPNVPYHRFAKLIGLKEIYVDRPEKICTGLGRNLGGAATRGFSWLDGWPIRSCIDYRESAEPPLDVGNLITARRGDSICVTFRRRPK